MKDFDTALRPYVQKRLEEIEEADILIGIPCFNNEQTVVHVVQMVSHGLFQHYRSSRAVVMVADGGSTDDTRDLAAEFQLRPWQEKLVTIYRGLPGKGSALRAVFETADRLKVKACAVVDADLRSINPDWVRYLLEPVLERGFEFVAPIYSRYKYDGTITNNIVYNLTRALYGKRIRQPIGGDFAFSRELARHYLEHEVWATDIARFGIDIWMTTHAVVHGHRVCQANLGVKIHDAKDPAESLGPMFRQVCGTLFSLMEENEAAWLPIRGSEPVPVFGMEGTLEPEPINVNRARMIQEFRDGYQHFSSLWTEIFSEEVCTTLSHLAGAAEDEFVFPIQAWVKLLYELAAKYHQMPTHRMNMVGLMTPLYLARVASFIQETKDMSSRDAEQVVEEQAAEFEVNKDYLVAQWQKQEEVEDLSQSLAERP